MANSYEEKKKDIRDKDCKEDICGCYQDCCGGCEKVEEQIEQLALKEGARRIINNIKSEIMKRIEEAESDYEQGENSNDETFCRLANMKKFTFQECLSILAKAQTQKTEDGK